MASKASLETALRNEYLDAICEFISDHFNADALRVSASEIAVPVVDAEQNEKFILIKISVPRGTRNGDGTYNPYDGYTARDDYAIELAGKADKAAKRKEKAERTEKEKERKREARKVVKKLNTVGFNALVTQPPEQDDDNQFLPHEVTI